MTKKLYIKTYGCQMNVYDSLRMQDVLKPHGYESCQEPEDADMVVLNTCHIREKAAEKMYSELGRINHFKEKRKTQKDKPKMMIAVAGCVGQAEGEEIFKRAPQVDIIVGPQSIQTLPDLVARVNREQGHAINLEMADDKFDNLPEETKPQGVSAFLSIQEGCDKFCTFCVVPYTRGAEYSRPVAAIYRDAIKMVAQGAKEIVLLGQNVNAYHGQSGDGETWDLGKLISHLATIKGLERIRYTTSHPRDMHESLYRAHAEIEQLMPFLHLPVQSGSDNILKAMNRKHNRDLYFQIVDKLRQARGDMQLSSDFIVGFPGETDQDFEDTMDLVRQVNFAQCYSFKYSPRPGTPGAELEDQIPESVKDERLQALQALLREQQKEAFEAAVGKTLPVLLEKPGRHEGQLIGKSPYLQSVVVENSQDLAIGSMVNVDINQASTNSLLGTVQ